VAKESFAATRLKLLQIFTHGLTAVAYIVAANAALFGCASRVLIYDRCVFSRINGPCLSHRTGTSRFSSSNQLRTQNRLLEDACGKGG